MAKQRTLKLFEKSVEHFDVAGSESLLLKAENEL
jgi:hypothetical protein